MTTTDPTECRTHSHEFLKCAEIWRRLAFLKFSMARTARDTVMYEVRICPLCGGEVSRLVSEVDVFRTLNDVVHATASCISVLADKLRLSDEQISQALER